MVNPIIVSVDSMYYVSPFEVVNQLGLDNEWVQIIVDETLQVIGYRPLLPEDIKKVKEAKEKWQNLKIK